MEGRQIISTSWMNEYSRWDASEAQVRPGSVNGDKNVGYKRFLWHQRPDGSMPVFSGAFGQRVYVDLPTQTVMVHTAAADEKDVSWQKELLAMFEAAVAL